MAQKTVVINRGPRTFNLKDGPNGEKRTLPPGGSIECLDEAEAKHLLSYFREIADAEKVMPATVQKVGALESEVEKLKAENEKLKAEQPAPEPEPEPEQEAEAPKHKSRKKGR